MASKNTSQHIRSALAASCLTGLIAVGSISAAHAEDDPHAPPQEPDGGVSQGDIDASIHVWSISESIIVWNTSENIIELGSGEPEDENVIVLETDILFSSNEWELPSSANAKIAELVEEIPEGASVRVHGHTDSLPVDESLFDFDNQELSENRAEAVADVLSDERSDLSLNVEGFGDSAPAVDEDPEDPSTFAANRRVEIRYD